MDNFTLQSVGVDKESVYAGEIVGFHGGWMMVKITQGFEDLIYSQREGNQFYTLNFITNRLMYQLVLNALKWFEDHKLHEILINNPLYAEIDYCIFETIESQFVCPYSNALNDDQKTAVKYMVWSQKKGIPMILHGPPGKIKYI